MSSWIAAIQVLDTNSVPQTLYFSDDGYTTASGIYYEARMRQPAIINITGNDGGLLSVMSSNSVGEIELDNTDGYLDFMADYYIDGRDCVLQLVDDDGIFTTWFRGIVTRQYQKGNNVYLTVKSLSEALDTPFSLSRYDGSGTTHGVEGLATDIRGNVKPRVYGRVINATPVLCNSHLGIYQVSDLSTCTITAVYDKGVVLTPEASPRASLEALTGYIAAGGAEFDTPPAAGYYSYYQGYFRIGSMQVQQVTCSAEDSVVNAGDVFTKICQNITFSSGIRTIGEVPVTLSSTEYRYQASASNTITINQVFNDGTPLDYAGSPYASLSELLATAPPAGQWRDYKGYFRLTPPIDDQSYDIINDRWNSIIIGNITYNSTDLSITYATTQTVTVNTDSVYGINAVLNQLGPIGIYITSDTTVRQLLDSIVLSGGAYWWFGDAISTTNYASNKINVALYQEPSSIPDITIENWQIISVERTSTGVGQNGLPIYSAMAKYDKIETIQTDVYGVVSDNFRTWQARLLIGSLINESADLTVKLKHPQSTRLEFNSLCHDQTAVNTRTTSLLSYFKKRCDIVDAVAYFDELPRITLNMTVRLYYNRLGYTNGVNFRLVGYEIDIKRKRVTMRLMGYKLT
jgi:hypothetical protein